MTTDNVMTADEALRLLDGREAKGRWRPGTVEHEGKVWAHDPDALGGASVGEVCIFNANMHAPHNGNRALAAAAPRLAASVVALHAEVAALRKRAHNAEAMRDLFVGAAARLASTDEALAATEAQQERDALRAQLAQVTAERDALRARAEVTAERTRDHDGRRRLAGLDAIEARARRRPTHRNAIGPTFESHGRADVLLLVEEVRRLHGSVDALRARAELAETERADALSELTRAIRECDVLREIVEGSTTPPSDEEIAAHEASSRGWWLFVLRGYPDVSTSPREAREWAQYHREHHGMYGCRWWPLDAHGRPCGVAGGHALKRHGLPEGVTRRDTGAAHE